MKAAYQLPEALQLLDIEEDEFIKVASKLEIPLYVRPSSEFDFRECLYGPSPRLDRRHSHDTGRRHHLLNIRHPLPSTTFLEVSPGAYTALSAGIPVIVKDFPASASISDKGVLVRRKPTWTKEELKMFTRPELPDILYRRVIQAFPQGMSRDIPNWIHERQALSIDFNQLWLSAQSLEAMLTYVSDTGNATPSPLAGEEWMTTDLITLHQAAQRLARYRSDGTTDSKVQKELRAWIGREMQLSPHGEHVNEAWNIIAPPDHVNKDFEGRKSEFDITYESHRVSWRPQLLRE